ncbi:MAG: DUF4412 domain-containing protein, partial [Gemmatimonadaceae bacterium]
VTAAGARSVPAQAPFEGVVSVKVTDADAGALETQYYVRNGAFRMEMVGPDGEKSVWITDPRRQVIYIITPAQRAYTQMTIPADDPTDPAEEEPNITKTGRTETIAGYRCEQWRVKDEDGEEYDLCITRGLGNFFEAAGPTSQFEQAWLRKLGRDSFPLRFTEVGPSGMSWQVTRIEKRSLDPSLFTPPAGYKKVEMPMGAPPQGA